MKVLKVKTENGRTFYGDLESLRLGEVTVELVELPEVAYDSLSSFRFLTLRATSPGFKKDAV